MEILPHFSFVSENLYLIRQVGGHVAACVRRPFEGGLSGGETRLGVQGIQFYQHPLLISAGRVVDGGEISATVREKQDV